MKMVVHMENEVKVKILSVLDVPSTREGRAGKIDRIFSYVIEGVGTFTTVVAKEDFEGKPFETQLEMLKSLIKREHQERIKWIGQEFKL